MANQDIGAVFQDLAFQMSGLSTAIGTQGIAQMIPPYDGTPSKFKEWIRNIEKYSVLMNVPQERVKLIAYQTSSGNVSSFLQRYLADHENITWPDLKAELASRFAEITDSQHAFMLLRKVKQKRDESVQMYGERLLTLAEEAYVGQPGGLQAIERQLVGFFIDGLLHDYLKMKVMRENPVNLQAAVTVAMSEQNLRKRFDLRTGQKEKYSHSTYNEQEPMEIDHYRPRKYCFKCKKQGHFANNCRTNFGQFRQVKQVNAVTKQKPQIICWNCNKPGHVKKNCRSRLNKRDSSAQTQEN